MISDAAIAKAVVYRKGKPTFASNSNDPIGRYADPEHILFRLAHQMHNADVMQRKQPCVRPFSAPVLAQGVEDLFHFPR